MCRSDIAWKDAKYAQIWEYLRDEFELTQRFASLDFKLKFVEVKCFFFIWKFVLVFLVKLKGDGFVMHFDCSITFGFFKRFCRTGNRIFWSG